MRDHEGFLFGIGIVGLLFYAIGPIIFPHIDNLRQPELLPVYSLMIGLGKLVRDWKNK